MTPVLIESEHLAKVGSPEEADDLRRNPALARAAAEQEARIEESLRRQKQIPDLQIGDPVLITDSDPRPSLRGQRGRVLGFASAEFGDVGCVGVASCEVGLDSLTASVVRVKITNLRHAPVAAARR